MTQIVEEEKGFGREHPGHGMVVGGYGEGQFWGGYSLMRGYPGQERLYGGRFPKFRQNPKIGSCFISPFLQQGYEGR